MLGVDFAGSIKYQDKRNYEKKSYLVMFACSQSRASGDLELVSSLVTEEFICSLKKLLREN